MSKYGKEFDSRGMDDWVPTRDGESITNLELLIDIANMLYELTQNQNA